MTVVFQVGVLQGDQTEDNDEDDPEYKAPQVTAEEEEEEYRTDMAVKVSCKSSLWNTQTIFLSMF